MKGLFAPAVGLMNRLTYPRKFVLISMLFALPLGFVMTALLHEFDRVTVFSQKEAAGVRYLQPLRRLLAHALEAKLAVYADINGRTPAPAAGYAMQLAPLQADIAELSALDAQWGGEFESTAKLATLRERVQALQDETTKGYSTAGLARELNPLVPEIRDLAHRIGDASNLILDPEVDSYYLAAGLVRDLPQNEELLAEILVLTDETDPQAPNLAAEIEINTLRRILSDSATTIPNAVNLALKGTRSPALARRLAPSLQAFRDNEQALLAALDSLNFSDTRRANFPILGQRAIAAGFEFWDAMAGGLDDLLQARLAATARQKYVVLAVAGAASLVVLYLWIAFYLGVMRTVAHLREASQRMQGGEFAAIALDSRDELAEVVQSFNAVAASLKAGEERLRTVLDSSPVPMLITRFPDGRVLYANRSASSLTGCSATELLQRSAPDFYIDLADRSKVHAAVREHGRLQSFEMAVKRADGTSVWVAMSVEAIGFQKEQALLVGLHDLTERRRVEAALRASEDRFRAIAESTPIPVAIAHVDDDAIVYTNRAVDELFGLPTDRLRAGRRARDSYLAADGRAKMLAALKAGDGLRDYEVQMKKADGAPFWVALSATLITYDGRACVLTTFYDLDARKRLEFDLQRAADTLREANAALALSRDAAEVRAERAQLAMLRYQLNPHFLFNSLNTVRSFVLTDPEKARDMVTRLSAFCRLSVTRPETETVPLRDEWALIDHYLAMEKYRWGDRITVEAALDPIAAEIAVPPFLLQPLVENAVKYGQQTSPQHLGVRLSARIAGGRVEVEIANTGRWLAPGSHTTEGTHTGLDNLRLRLRQIYRDTATFDIGGQDGWVVARLVLPPARPANAAAPVHS